MAGDTARQEDESGFIAPPKPIKVGRQKPEDMEKPISLSGRNMAKAKRLSDNLLERRRSLHKTMGEPFKGAQLSDVDRKRQYKDVISSRDILMNALVGAAIIGRDGRLRIRTDMVDAFRELSG